MVKDGKLKAKDVKNDTIIYVGEDNLHYEKFADDTIKCIEDEIPFEIPESWAWVRLGDVGIWGAGATPSRAHPEFYDGTIPWLKTGDLTDTYITSVPENISQLALEKTSVRINPVGSVLIAMYGATIGKLGILTFPATTNQACCACAPLDGIEELYLFYFLMSQRAIFIKRAEGGAQSNISKEKIISTLIPIPPSIEQKQIIEKIESYELFLLTLNNSKIKLEEAICLCKSKILDLAIRGKLVPQDESDEPASVLLEQIQVEKEELIRQGKIKRDKRESVIYRGMDNSYYERFADGSEKCIDEEIPFEIPGSWLFVRLKEIGSIIGGGTPRTSNESYWDGNINWITPADLSNHSNIYISHGSRSITELGLKDSSATLMPAHTVLYSSRAPIGHIAIAANALATNQGFKSVVPHDTRMSLFVYFCLKERTPSIVLRATGTTFKEISGTAMAETIVPLPPLREQKRICNKIRSLFTLLENMHQIID